MIEGFVRLALFKYPDDEPHKAVAHFFQVDVLPNASRSKPNTFRAENFYVKSSEELYTKYQEPLTIIFQSFAEEVKSEYFLLEIHAFIGLFTQVDLMDEILTHEELKSCFIQSKLLGIDEYKCPEHTSVTYVDFLEAISRAAAIKVLGPGVPGLQPDNSAHSGEFSGRLEMFIKVIVKNLVLQSSNIRLKQRLRKLVMLPELLATLMPKDSREYQFYTRRSSRLVSQKTERRLSKAMRRRSLPLQKAFEKAQAEAAKPSQLDLEMDRAMAVYASGQAQDAEPGTGRRRKTGRRASFHGVVSAVESAKIANRFQINLKAAASAARHNTANQAI